MKKISLLMVLVVSIGCGTVQKGRGLSQISNLEEIKIYKEMQERRLDHVGTLNENMREREALKYDS